MKGREESRGADRVAGKRVGVKKREEKRKNNVRNHFFSAQKNSAAARGWF